MAVPFWTWYARFMMVCLCSIVLMPCNNLVLIIIIDTKAISILYRHEHEKAALLNPPPKQTLLLDIIPNASLLLVTR